MRSLSARVRDDQGVAIIAVMGVLSVVTVIAIAAWFLGQQTLHESVQTRQKTSAFQVASAGMDAALADVQANGFQASHFTPAKTGTLSGLGSYEVTLSTLPSGEYQATSVGTATDGTVERVAVQFFYLNLWDMSIGGGDDATIGGGRGFNGNAAIDGPIYIRGIFDWSANAAFTRGPMFIRPNDAGDGWLDISGSGDVGTVAQPVKLYCVADIRGKVGNFKGTQTRSCPDIQLPWVDDAYMDAALIRAKDQSVDGFMGVAATQENWEADNGDPATYETALNTATSGQVLSPNVSSPTRSRVRPWTPGASGSKHYKYIGPASGRSSLGAGTTNLTIGGSSFGAYPGWGFAPSASFLYDDFAFDASTGTLYLNGTVFVDGDVTFTSAVNGYVGNGTLVVNGDIINNGNLAPMGTTTPVKGAFAAEKCIGLVTPGNVRNDDLMICAVFCNETFSLYGVATHFVGSALAGTIYGDKPNITITMDPTLKTVLPASMPGAGGGWLATSAWTRL